MKRATCLAAMAMTLALTGCAELQQASGLVPASQPQAQPQAMANQGTQQVQPANTAVTTQAPANNQVAAASAEESSFVGDMVKAAGDTVKSEASSTVRSTIRGIFNN